MPRWLRRYRNRASVFTAALDSGVTSPPPAPAPPGTVTWSGPITISSGGTYTGNWESTSASTSPVTITTAQPVTIVNSRIRNLQGSLGTDQQNGALIRSEVSGAQLTVQNSNFYGKTTDPARRLIYFYRGRTILVENCTFSGGTGIYMLFPEGGTPSATIRRNKFTNIQGNGTTSNGGYWTQAIQFNGWSTGTHRVEWNQVINTYGQSRSEDVISVFSTNNVTVANNFIWGSYPSTLSQSHSGSGIMLSDFGGQNNVAEYNQVVACINAGIGIAGGSNNTVRFNTVVSDTRTDSGQVFTNVSSSGIGIFIANFSGGTMTNDVFSNNSVGVVNNAGNRNDFYTPNGTDGGGNTSLSGTIDYSREAGQYSTWLTKLSTNGVTVGSNLG